jgi:2-amino-4-hydroxy-6-hydroxymethyldihydropteridine diphosphokinase
VSSAFSAVNYLLGQYLRHEIDSRFACGPYTGNNPVVSATVYIALGSNLGDRQGHLTAALEAISALPGVLAVEHSPVYETEPVVSSSCRDSSALGGKFLNSVTAVKTTLQADVLLAALHRIEADQGRDRAAESGRNEPRSLDLDILLYGDEVINYPGELPGAGLLPGQLPGTGVTVPHPRMHERWFVLKPLCDLAPDVVHPVLKRTASQLLAGLETPAT